MALLDGAAPKIVQPEGLITRRLLVRPPALADAPALVALLNDRRIAQNTLRIPHPYQIADARAFISSANTSEDEIVFLITRNSAPGVIGACGIARLTFAGPELGYWIGVPFWGLGYATEAVCAVIDHAFRGLGNEFLGAGARVTNPASRRVLEKCGFRWTGVALGRIRALGASVPIDRFRLERGRWHAFKSAEQVAQKANAF
jgi:RimJ/RimL family protein N-acetyltransferase